MIWFIASLVLTFIAAFAVLGMQDRLLLIVYSIGVAGAAFALFKLGEYVSTDVVFGPLLRRKANVKTRLDEESHGKDTSLAKESSLSNDLTLPASEASRSTSELLTTEVNQRSAFRVPVWPTSGLSATLQIDQTVHVVKPLNLCLTGVSIEFTSADAPELPTDGEVEITLTFEGAALTLPGVVKCRKVNGYGIFFPESLRREQLDPPSLLVEIVVEMQRRLVAKRR